MDAKTIAYALRSDLENCMHDLANGDEIAADEYWNDPNVLSDILGDRIFDVCNCLRTDDDKILAWEIAEYLIEIGHDALEEAASGFRWRHNLI